MHGEALHLSEHARIARKCGVKEVIQCRNGDLVRLSPKAGLIDEVPAGRIYKDGRLLVDAQARTVADRKRLSFAGSVSVALALTEKGELVDDPSYDLLGIPERDREGVAMHEIVHDAVLDTFELAAARQEAGSGCGRRGRAPRRARRGQRPLGQEAHVPRACAEGMMLAAFPGRSAARAKRSGALQTRDRRAWNGPGSAMQRCTPHRVRDKKGTS